MPHRPTAIIPKLLHTPSVQYSKAKSFIGMKKTTLILIGVLLSLGVYAQAPQGFNYQAVVRNDQGAPLSGQQVSIRISLQDEAGVITHCSETHSVTTSPQGLASFVVGSGTVQNGTFANIPWAEGNIYMKIEVDPTGGNGYTTLGVSQLQSVPYALHAQTANRFEAIPGAGDEALLKCATAKAKWCLPFTNRSAYLRGWRPWR